MYLDLDVMDGKHANIHIIVPNKNKKDVYIYEPHHPSHVFKNRRNIKKYDWNATIYFRAIKNSLNKTYMIY